MDFEGGDLNIFLRRVYLGGRPLGLVLLVVLRGDGDILDDGYVQPGLALRIFVQFSILELGLCACLRLVIVQLVLDCLEVYRPISGVERRNEVDIIFGISWILVVESVMLDF